MMARVSEDAPRSATDRASWLVRVCRLGVEPSSDLSATTTPERRLAMMEPLALKAFGRLGE